MKLATLRAGGRDGVLVVVRGDGRTFARATAIAPTLQAALDDWNRTAPRLQQLAADLNAGRATGEDLDVAVLASPLPRPYAWIDASAFLHHVRLVRKARGAEPPADYLTVPLVYQGAGGTSLGACDPIPFARDADVDFEAEVAVILGDTPRGTPASTAEHHIRLVCLANDITYRKLVPAELARGFGFFASKPVPAFSPFAVTPDELGQAWRGGRLHLPVRVSRGGTLVGNCDAGAMHFSFFDLIAHIAQTRHLVAGTILGSGTVSNEDRPRGISCLVERRMIEKMESGQITTPFLTVGERVRIEVVNDAGDNVFGAIDQVVIDQESRA